MIVPMKKATILVLAEDAETTVAALRQMGVLHIEHQNPPESPDLPVLQEQEARIDTALGILASVPEHTRIPPGTTDTDSAGAADLIIGLDKQRVELESSERTLRSRIAEWEPWGDFDATRVRNLQKRGIFLRLFRVPAREINRFPADVVVRTLALSDSIARCVVIARHPFDCPFEEIAPPETGLAALRENLKGTSAALIRINEEIARAAGFKRDLVQRKQELIKEIKFRQVVSGMGWEGRIGYITGYLPSDYADELIRKAKSRKWGIVITDPAPEDMVPTLLRNPPWVERIRPVFGLLGIMPGYRELDISMLFLIFFGIFFGILIGDAGYGLVYVLATLVLEKVLKSPAGLRTTFSLFYYMGSFAILWGILTGTFFGQAWLLNTGYQPLVPQLNNATDMQTFCFFLGAFHLSIAHAWRAYVKLPSIAAIADGGWICILWAAFFLARTLILGAPFPSFGIWLVGAGIALVVLFSHPQASILRTLGSGMGTVALSLVNNLTDVISYIRLFAVGLATLAIAETTNTLASGFGTGVTALVAGGVILIIGHGINLILGPMSVLVHGVRLNVLEFSGHANVTWSGVAFEPFREGSEGDHG